MPELTRRLTWPDDKNARDCWSIYYDGAGVGGISRRSGIPNGYDQWQWSCGMYPGGPHLGGVSGTAATFEEARAAFQKAWLVYLPKLTPEGLQEWRDHDEWTTDKYTLWDAGFNNLTIPLKCSCGQSFKAGDRGARRLHIPHLTGRNR